MESPENGDGDGMETPKTCRTRLCHVRSFLANLGISEDAMVPCHPGWASWCQKCGHGESLSSGIEFATCYRKHATSTCNILQHLATSCNILQHLATSCNILQHLATSCNHSKKTVTVHWFALFAEVARACANFGVSDLIVPCSSFLGCDMMVPCVPRAFICIHMPCKVVHTSKLQAAVGRAGRSSEKACCLEYSGVINDWVMWSQD